jgi:hypothetical protein
MMWMRLTDGFDTHDEAAKWVGRLFTFYEGKRIALAVHEDPGRDLWFVWRTVRPDELERRTFLPRLDAPAMNILEYLADFDQWDGEGQPPSRKREAK